MTIDDFNNLLLPHKPLDVRLLHTKAQLRYRLYRKRASVTDESIPYDMEEEILTYFENQENFFGWKNFASLWDIKYKENKWVAYQRVFTEEEEWNAVLRRETTIIPMRRKKANKLTDE